jgi:hypothetical protein
VSLGEAGLALTLAGREEESTNGGEVLLMSHVANELRSSKRKFD